MKGIVPSLNTPFSKKGSLDHNSLAKLVEHTIKSGCNGMLGLAVAGEGQSLSFEEKIELRDISFSLARIANKSINETNVTKAHILLSLFKKAPHHLFHSELSSWSFFSLKNPTNAAILAICAVVQ